MPRRKRNVGREGRLPRGDLKPNRDRKPGKILSAFRKVDSDSSSLIGGVLSELQASNDIPDFKSIPTGHRAFIFDPRRLDQRFNRGVLAYAKFVEFRREAEVVADRSDDAMYPRLAGVRLLEGKRRILLARLEDPELLVEKSSFFKALAHVGISGFTTDGRIHGQRSVQPPEIAIGTFAAPISKASEDDVVDAVELGLDLALSGSDGRVELGELEIKTYSSPR